MSRLPLNTVHEDMCVPRASGDEPSNVILVVVGLMCSPRERG